MGLNKGEPLVQDLASAAPCCTASQSPWLSPMYDSISSGESSELTNITSSGSSSLVRSYKILSQCLILLLIFVWCC